MNSIRELSVCNDFNNQGFSSVPTLLSILYIDTIDEMFEDHSSDSSNIYKQIMEVKQCFLRLDCSIVECRNYGIRLMGLINYMLRIYGFDTCYCSKLLSSIKSSADKWKKVLYFNMKMVNSDPSVEAIFLHKS